MTMQSALTFFAAIFVFSITPGPGVFAIIGRSLQRGARQSLALCAGMAFSDVVYLVMACYGLAAIASQWETLFLVIRYCGAAYLLYLGWKMWTTPVAHDQFSPEKKTSKEGIASFLQGFLISSSNPKVILFYIAFLPSFIDVTSLHGMDIVLAATLAFTALMLGLTLIAVSASQARRYMKSERAMKSLNRTSGGIIAMAGLYLGLKG